MNSTYVKENLSKYMSALDRDSKSVIVRAALAFYESNRSGDSKRIQQAYQILLRNILAGERIVGVPLIRSTDGNYLCALNAFAHVIYSVTQKEYSRTFDSIAEANEFLKDKRNLILTNVHIKTRTTMGLFANHSVATQIIVTYKLGDGKHAYHYGICQQEKTHLFLRANNQGYAQRWEEKNPGFECVFVQHTSNARADASSLAFGFGLDYLEHVKHFVTYRRRLDVEQST